MLIRLTEEEGMHVGLLLFKVEYDPPPKQGLYRPVLPTVRELVAREIEPYFRPSDAFKKVKPYISRDLDMVVIGFLGKHVKATQVDSMVKLKGVWRSWWTQAVQARAALLRQRIEWPR